MATTFEHHGQQLSRSITLTVSVQGVFHNPVIAHFDHNTFLHMHSQHSSKYMNILTQEELDKSPHLKHVYAQLINKTLGQI